MQAQYVIPVTGSDGKSLHMEIKQKNHLGKRRKVKTWTAEEDTLLLKLYDQHPKKWSTIASLMNDRNQNQCLHRYRRLSQLGANRKIWSSEEDETIKRLIKKVGKNWKLLSESLGTKTGKQIRQRFINKLDPKIKKEEWTDQQDRKLIELYGQLGSKWSQISKKLPGRPQNKIKNRFYSFIQKNYDFKYRAVEQGALDANKNRNKSSITKNENRNQDKQKLQNSNRMQLGQITNSLLNIEHKEIIQQLEENSCLRYETSINPNFHLYSNTNSNYQNFNYQYSMQPFQNWQYQHPPINPIYSNLSHCSQSREVPSLSHIKLENDEQHQENMDMNKENSLFPSRIYLKSLLKIEDDWGMNNNNRFRSIHDITSQQEFGHQHDLLYLSHH